MTPFDYYEEKVRANEIFADSEQLIVLEQMQSLQRALTEEFHARKKRLALFRKPKLVRGLYLWGGVGIGKTFLMDCFYKTLPFPNKLREHFHAFMQRIHDQLVKHQGEPEPLAIIASELAQRYNVICFDEFFVSDITDAMLLGRLFEALFAKGVSLVATSNVPPDDLYKNGLQRLRFLPAIELLKKNTQVMHMPASTDYRLRHLQSAGVFYCPLDATAALSMEQSFEALTLGKFITSEPIVFDEREIKIVKASDDTIWFDFLDICSVPRSQTDYLHISQRYTTVFVSNIPVISAKEKDRICLFISLVDVLYDAKVRLVASAAEPVDQLYLRGAMQMEYTRTRSRLLEMQSEDYFSGELKKNNPYLNES